VIRFVLVFILAYGVCWFQAVVALLNLLDGRSRPRSDALLSRYPLPDSAIGVELVSTAAGI
jgi:hypothetical protein